MKCVLPLVITQMEHSGPNLFTSIHLMTFFRGQKARFVTSWGLKMARFAPKWTFCSPQGDPKRSTNGSVMPFLYILASWTIMSCLEPNLVPYKTSRGANTITYHVYNHFWWQNVLKTSKNYQNWMWLSENR